MKIKQKQTLKPWHTFKTDSEAEQLYVIENEQDLEDVAEKDLGSFYILGGGSNILPTGKIKKPILKNELKGIKKINETYKSAIIEVKSGENWHQFVKTTVEKKLGGIENLALIPGTVGGAVIQNAGAYGMEIKDSIESVKVFNLNSGEEYSLTKDECKFGYRDSIFKKEEYKNLFIISATFKLKKEPTPNLSYSSLQRAIKKKNIKNPTIQDTFSEVCEIRKNKLPDWEHTPTAGSFFKNPFIDKNKLKKLQQNFPEMPYFDTKRGIKLSAGWLIEQIEDEISPPKGVKTFENHSLTIINPGEKSGNKVYKFSEKIKDKVEEKFGIKLNNEVKIW
ncbi:MAG: UDP-N-acetylmuramate dehydrogenase [Candidatus Magasanikbacteria bacterium]